VYVCVCNGVTDHDIRQAAASGCSGMTELTMRTGCGASCGSCVDVAVDLLEQEARAREASRSLPLARTLADAA
jgi:bacterioferritin-associated ferredoxin